MFPEKQEVLEHLEVVAYRLHELQSLLQEGAPCARLLCELKPIEKALASIQIDLVKCNLRSSLFVLQSHQDNEIHRKELRKIFELFSVTADF